VELFQVTFSVSCNIHFSIDCRYINPWRVGWIIIGGIWKLSRSELDLMIGQTSAARIVGSIVDCGLEETWLVPQWVDFGVKGFSIHDFWSLTLKCVVHPFLSENIGIGLLCFAKLYAFVKGLLIMKYSSTNSRSLPSSCVCRLLPGTFCIYFPPSAPINENHICFRFCEFWDYRKFPKWNLRYA
jgi:hypothetical protein